MTQKDWVAQWYVLAKERGVNDIFSFGRVDLETSEIQWFDLSHSVADGIGAMAIWFENQGHYWDNLPESTRVQKIPFWKKPGVLFKSLPYFKSQKPKWKFHDLSKKPASQHDFGWIVFSDEETRRFEQYVRDQKVSENALLLETLNAILLPDLLADETLNGRWLFPVNMRGAIRKPNFRSNHSSAIPIQVNAFTTAMDIHSQIKLHLSGGIHWAIWWSLHIGKIVGTNGMRFLSKKSERNNFWLGTFSNMGAWPPPELSKLYTKASEVWIVVPPGTPNYPISIGCMRWNGKLSVSLKIHPSICPEENTHQRAQRYLDLVQKVYQRKLPEFR